ncbi:hypothetical protein SDJN02_20417, partial [Cucurbita argyrosperma subsp. argyrosperma]
MIQVSRLKNVEISQYFSRVGIWKYENIEISAYNLINKQDLKLFPGQVVCHLQIIQHELELFLVHRYLLLFILHFWWETMAIEDDDGAGTRNTPGLQFEAKTNLLQENYSHSSTFQDLERIKQRQQNKQIWKIPNQIFKEEEKTPE